MKQAVFHTKYGTMTAQFFPDKAPRHVDNFLELAGKGFYDGLTFHRIMDGFMIQGGCPKGNGTGNGPRRLLAEFNDTPHDVGILSMARAADPNSASCQFFICLARCDFLDGNYTVFGRLVDDASLQTLRKIGKVAVRDNGYGERSSPVEPVRIDRIVVEDVPEA